MKAVVLDMPQAWLDERRRHDLDRKDEMWEGVLHMVPPASSAHNALGARLMALLLPIAGELAGFFEPGIFDPAIPGMSSYRVADLGFAVGAHVSPRGIEGHASSLVEVLSPSDESYEKLAFYRRVGVEELLYVDPGTKVFEVMRPGPDGWRVIATDDDGWVDLVSLGVALRTIGHRLQIRIDGRMTEL